MTPETAGQQFAPGQTVLFLGDHSSPDDSGYVRIMAGVLARFQPHLNLNLLSAGSKRQSAHGLRSPLLMEILSSSRPDWLSVSVGLGDATREPSLRQRMLDYQIRRAAQTDVAEATFGPEHHVRPADLGPLSDNGREQDPELERLVGFTSDLSAAVEQLSGTGVRPILLTTVLVGDDTTSPLNVVLRLYSKSIREVAKAHSLPLVDVERAFREVLDRADTYNKTVALTAADATLNAQGEALLARTFLHTFGVLPYPGYRPLR